MWRATLSLLTLSRSRGRLTSPRTRLAVESLLSLSSGYLKLAKEVEESAASAVFVSAVLPEDVFPRLRWGRSHRGVSWRRTLRVREVEITFVGSSGEAREGDRESYVHAVGDGMANLFSEAALVKLAKEIMSRASMPFRGMLPRFPSAALVKPAKENDESSSLPSFTAWCPFLRSSC